MPTFLVERNFSEKPDLNTDSTEQINNITNELGAEWLYTFLSADGKKSYCLYEAKDPEHLREHARIIGIPADRIVQVEKCWPRSED